MPASWYEQAFALVLMLAGGAIYAFLVGAVSSIVSGFDRATQQFRQDLDAINTYMDSINLPYSQRIKVREFYELSLDLYRNKHYQHLLRFLSPALRGMVAAHMHESWITQISFF